MLESGPPEPASAASAPDDAKQPCLLHVLGLRCVDSQQWRSDSRRPSAGWRSDLQASASAAARHQTTRSAVPALCGGPGRGPHLPPFVDSPLITIPRPQTERQPNSKKMLYTLKGIILAGYAVQLAQASECTDKWSTVRCARQEKKGNCVVRRHVEPRQIRSICLPQLTRCRAPTRPSRPRRSAPTRIRAASSASALAPSVRPLAACVRPSAPTPSRA